MKYYFKDMRVELSGAKAKQRLSKDKADEQRSERLRGAIGSEAGISGGAEG